MLANNIIMLQNVLPFPFVMSKVQVNTLVQNKTTQKCFDDETHFFSFLSFLLISFLSFISLAASLCTARKLFALALANAQRS